jgi:hypothetical protein
VVPELPPRPRKKSAPARRSIQHALPAANQRESSSTVDGKSYTDQAELGTDLLKKYNVRNVKDITTCSTCHR